VQALPGFEIAVTGRSSERVAGEFAQYLFMTGRRSPMKSAIRPIPGTFASLANFAV